MQSSVSQTISIFVATVVLCGLLSGGAAGSGLALPGDQPLASSDTSGGVGPVEQADADRSSGPSVSEPNGSITFNSTVRGYTRGDVATITIEFSGTDDAVVRIEGSQTPYRANLSVSPNDDGVATIRWNTFHAGTGASQDAFRATSGTVSVIDETDVVTDRVPRIIEDDYDVVAYHVLEGNSSDLEPGFSDDRIERDADSTIYLDDRDDRIYTGTPWIAANGSVAPGSADGEALRDVATQSDTVAADDMIAVQFLIDGVFGYLSENGTFDPHDQGLSLEIHSGDGENRWSLSDEGIELLPVPERDEVFLVVDTATVNRMDGTPAIEPGEQYEFQFEIDGDENDYVPAGTTERETVEMTVQERTLDIDGVFENDLLQLPAGEQAVLVAETTIAPGSEIQFDINPAGDDATTASATVAEDYTAKTTTDLSEYDSETNATVTARDLPGNRSVQVDAVFVEPQSAAELVIEDLAVSPSEAETGQRVELEATVRNTGTGTANASIEGVVDGDVIGTRAAGLGPGEMKTVRFDVELPAVTEDRTTAAGIRLPDSQQTTALLLSVDVVQSAGDPIDRRWRGQSLTITDVDPNSTVRLYEVSDGTERLIDERMPTDRGRYPLRTSNLEPGRYRLETDAGTRIATFPIAEQTIDEFATQDRSIRYGQSTGLTVRSNRSGYSIEVTDAYGNLDATELASLFDPSSVSDVDEESGTVSLEVPEREMTFEIDTVGVPPDWYKFHATIPDTGLEANSTLIVTTNDTEFVDPSVAPVGTIDADTDGTAIPELTTQQQSVAFGDVGVVRFDDELFDLEPDATLEEAFNVTAIRPEGRYEPRRTWTLGDDGVSVHYDDTTGDVYASVNTTAISEDDATPSLSPGSEVSIVLSVNESSAGATPDPVEQLKTELNVTQRSVEVKTPEGSRFNNRLAETGQTDVTVVLHSSLAPGTELGVGTVTDGVVETVPVASDGTATATVDFSSVPLTELRTITVEEASPGRAPTNATTGVDVVIVSDPFDGRRSSLNGTTLGCCTPVGVSGFEPGQAVSLVDVNGAAPIDTDTADQSGAITIDTATADPGTFVLEADDGTTAGPFRIERAEFVGFETDRAVVERGEELALTIETDRDTAIVELTSSASIPARTLTESVENATIRPGSDDVLAGLPNGQGTITIDTTHLQPGTHHIGGAIAGMDATATTTFEVRDNGTESVETAVVSRHDFDTNSSVRGIKANATLRETVAYDDAVVVATPEPLGANATVTLRNQSGDGTWSLDDEGIDRRDGSQQTLVTVDTGAVDADGSIATGAAYTVEIADGDTEYVGMFEVVNRSFSFVTFNHGDRLRMPPDEATPITARTSLAPGSPIFFRAMSGSPNPFIQDATVTVSDRGTAAPTFNFSARSRGTEFTTRISDRYGGIRRSESAVFDDDAPSTGPTTPEDVTVDERIEAGGYEPGERVELWRVENGTRVELAGRTTATRRGELTFTAPLLDEGSYVLVDQYGNEAGPVTVFGPDALAPYANDDGRIDTDGLRSAVQHWQDGTIDTALLRGVIDAWSSGDSVVDQSS